MHDGRSQLHLVIALLFTGLLVMSCERASLPEVPAFEQLGFAASLDVVQRQVSQAYARWQEQPRNALRNGHLGMLLSVYGHHAAAETLYRRARLLAPGEFRWAYYLAINVYEGGRSEEAVALLHEALAINPDYLPGRLRLARLLLEINEAERSAELYRSITAQFPERVEGWLGLGKALERSGNLPAAAEALGRASRIGAQYGEVHYALAAVLSARGDEEGAAREFAAYERTAGNSIRTPDPLLREVYRLNAGDAPFMSRADYELSQGRLEEAIQSLRGALAINPSNQDAWAVLVDTQARLGALEQARESYRAALAAGISSARLHLGYGHALVQAQRLDAAREIIGRAVESDPQHVDALLALGKLELQRGAGTAGIEALRRYLALVPNDREVALTLARELNAIGRHGEALKRLAPLADEAGANAPATFMELAVAYYGVGRRSEALNALQRARAAALQSGKAEALDAIDALRAEWQGAAAGRSD